MRQGLFVKKPFALSCLDGLLVHGNSLVTICRHFGLGRANFILKAFGDALLAGL